MATVPKTDLQALHDVRDRRHSNMQRALDAITGCVDDLTQFPGNEGVSYLVADKLARLAVELETFKARDLLNLREVAKGRIG